jgi:hypothetical protein
VHARRHPLDAEFHRPFCKHRLQAGAAHPATWAAGKPVGNTPPALVVADARDRHAGRVDAEAS